ncbi:Actin-related protein 2/3 complex subunit 5-like protein [Armadillidium vulgare]|uniref:Actin-related protein 2/3 complex subunit 5 n=1 Tax=Armadillidium nasatum TaxID=96803 RepID=A0A5N5SUM4_9CRUS|nr:Actin-related protein 2/3 complex subunit 5-like protein [Armadillidium nasatum]RXG73916.1 Actin-related protein 2/3 complex subunit 5-like protein [Armadillidium vulgare]
MAKNTFSSEFRNIDVDQYNEDNYKDEDAADAQTHIGIEESTIISLMNQGNHAEALKMLLQTAPMTSKGRNDQAKEAHLNLVLKVLLAVNKSQMDQIITVLDSTMLDVLMKYIYRGFERPSENSSAILLQWHEKVYNVAGVGCIVRVLTDRKRV